MTIDLSFVDSDDSSDSEEHMDFLSGNNAGIEHSDEDDHAELRAAVEEIDFDEFEGLHEDFYEDTANPSTSKYMSACFMAVPFISFCQYAFSITNIAVLVLLK